MTGTVWKSLLLCCCAFWGYELATLTEKASHTHTNDDDDHRGDHPRRHGDGCCCGTHFHHHLMRSGGAQCSQMGQKQLRGLRRR